MARFAVYINLSYKSIRVVKWIECALRNVLLYVCTNRRSNLWQRLCSYTKKDILSIKNVPILKVIRKFFFKHNKSFRLHLEDYEKHNFLHLKACERRNFDFCVFLRVGIMPGARVCPGVTTPLRPCSLYKPVFNGQTTHP